MKKLLTILMMFLLMMSFSLARDVEIEPKIEEISGIELQPFVVIGGDTGQGSTVEKGEIINDVILKTKFTEDNTAYCTTNSGSTAKYTSRLEVYFQQGTSGDKKNIKTFYFSSERNIGDVVNYKVSGLDTNIISDSWLNKGVRVGAVHRVCKVNTNLLEPGKWVLDDDYYGSYRGTNDDFTLVSDDSTCTRQFLERTCKGSQLVDEYQTTRTDFNGNCETDYTVVKNCADSCEEGQCVSKSSIGETKCSVGNTYVQTYTQNGWTLSICSKDNKGYCADGVCLLDQEKDNEDKTPIYGEDQTTAPPIGEDVKCLNGAINYAKCQDGSDTVISECIDNEWKDIAPDCEIDFTKDIEYDDGNPTNDLPWYTRFWNWIKDLFTF